MGFMFGKTERNYCLSIGILLIAVGFLVGCSSSDDTPAPLPDITIDLSGTIEDGNDTAISGVTVNAYLAINDTSAEDTATSDTNGNFTVTVIEGGEVYLELQHSNYVTLNSRIASFDTDQIGLDFDMFTEVEADFVIGTAFGGGLALVLANHAWLGVNVIDATSKNELDAQTVVVSPTPQNEGATDCNGVIQNSSNITTAPCPTRDGPMYLAYFDSNNDVTISVGGVIVNAPVRMGEVTVVNMEIP